MSPVQGMNPHQAKTKKKAAQHLNMHQIPVRGDPHVTLEQQNRNSRSKLNKVKNQNSTSGSNMAQMFNTHGQSNSNLYNTQKINFEFLNNNN